MLELGVGLDGGVTVTVTWLISESLSKQSLLVGTETHYLDSYS